MKIAEIDYWYIPDIFQVTVKQVSSAHDWAQNKLRNVPYNFPTRQSFNLLSKSI